MVEKKSKQIEKTARGGMVPFEDVDRWFEELSRDMFGRRWLSPFERLFPSFPEMRAPFELEELRGFQAGRGDFNLVCSLV